MGFNGKETAVGFNGKPRTAEALVLAGVKITDTEQLFKPSHSIRTVLDNPPPPKKFTPLDTMVTASVMKWKHLRSTWQCNSCNCIYSTHRSKQPVGTPLVRNELGRIRCKFGVSRSRDFCNSTPTFWLWNKRWQRQWRISSSTAWPCWCSLPVCWEAKDALDMPSLTPTENGANCCCT